MTGAEKAGSSNQDVQNAKAWIESADAILFTAGAGLTAAAGINYGDTDLFAREFPAMLQYGFGAQYEFIGRTNIDRDLFWGYWAAHVDLVRHRWPQTAPYQKLYSLASSLGEHDSFVLTSNVDAMFERNGFDPARIHTPQGDYALMQCTTPCTRNVWAWKAELDAIRAATDPQTQRTDPRLAPVCPTCGEPAWINVRIDASFIDDHFEPTQQALGRWVNERAETNTVVLEIGAGFNTPGVIRIPGERLVEHLPNWKLIRVNPEHAETPKALGERAIGLALDACEVIDAL